MNEGKIFENDFKASVPKDVYYLILHDSAIGFDVSGSKKRNKQRFSLKSPYDCILCSKGQMYCIELKTTKGSSFSFSGKSPYIKIRQVKELCKASKAGAISFLVLNFRRYGKTYAVKPDVFLNYISTLNKKSVNKSDMESIGILIDERKLKTHTRYNIALLIENTLKA